MVSEFRLGALTFVADDSAWLHEATLDVEALPACGSAHFRDGWKGTNDGLSPHTHTHTTLEIVVGPGHVARVVSRWTKIPLATLDQEENEKLIHLAKKLHERVIGQDEAVNLVAQAVLRSRLGFGQIRQLISAFLFLGPIGVGKTELAKALAEKIFDNEKALIRFDMSEYADSGSVSRLTGGSRSYEEYGQLTEKVKRLPYSVILFDQVDKANASVFKVFHQLLDDAMLTDGKGQVVDFKNTIVIMTSNIGAEHLPSRIMGENTIKSGRDLLMNQVKKRFKPELINRLNKVVIFEPLSHDELRKIVKIQINNVILTVASKGVAVHATDAALDVILSESHDPVDGARPIRRWVQNHVTTILSDMLVDGEACAGSTISIDAAADDKRGLTFQVLKKQQELADQ
ncbi:chaperone protein ClpB1-like [Triticum dicoccoides]|nr:chaperone protein ClpB1-like [Triticum dicoccoides]